MIKYIMANIQGENGDKLPIREFSLDDFICNPSIIMIAKRGSGKSWITKSILYKYSHIPLGIIISPTEKDSPFFSEFFPDTYIFYKYDSNILRKLLIRQGAILKKYREKKSQGYFIDPRAIIVMDDCLASKGTWAKDPKLYELLFNGRHRQLTYILTMQFPLGITPDLRSNFDYIFLLADDIISNLKRIYDHYAGMFPDFNSFRQVFFQLTSDYGSMVIKNRGARNNILDKIAFFKAPNLQDVKCTFGCKQMRKYHQKNYDKEWEEKQFKMDYDELLMDLKKSKSRINIKKIYKSDDNA